MLSIIVDPSLQWSPAWVRIFDATQFTLSLHWWMFNSNLHEFTSCFATLTWFSSRTFALPAGAIPLWGKSFRLSGCGIFAGFVRGWGLRGRSCCCSFIFLLCLFLLLLSTLFETFFKLFLSRHYCLLMSVIIPENQILSTLIFIYLHLFQGFYQLSPN